MLSDFLNNKINEKNKIVDISYEIKDNLLIIDFDFNLYRYDLYGKNCTIKFLNKTIINGSINDKILYQKQFKIDTFHKQLILDINTIKGYSYKGESLEFSHFVDVVVERNFFDDEKINKEIIIKKYHRDRYDKDYFLMKRLMDTLEHNDINFFTNYNNKFVKYFIYYVTIFFYFLTLIFQNLFFILIILYFTILFFSFYYLNNNNRFIKNLIFKTDNIILNKDKCINVNDFLEGTINSNVNDVKIRILAYNSEVYGEIFRSKESNSDPRKKINEILLYVKQIGSLSKGQKIEDVVDGIICFTDLFKKLYPPFKAVENFGMRLELDFQLIIGDKIVVSKKIPSNFLDDKLFSYS